MEDERRENDWELGYDTGREREWEYWQKRFEEHEQNLLSLTNFYLAAMVVIEASGVCCLTPIPDYSEQNSFCES